MLFELTGFRREVSENTKSLYDLYIANVLGFFVGG